MFLFEESVALRVSRQALNGATHRQQRPAAAVGPAPPPLDRRPSPRRRTLAAAVASTPRPDELDFEVATTDGPPGNVLPSLAALFLNLAQEGGANDPL
jgi:hypothetical protein